MTIDTHDLRSLLERMTPGEWSHRGWGDGRTDDGWTNIFENETDTLLVECIPVEYAELIVALRNAAPALLDEIERLRVENGRLRQHIADEANRFNISGSDWERVQQALDALLVGVKSRARAALGEQP